MGEVHDNPKAYLEQTALLRQISLSAVVFEMLNPVASMHANIAKKVILKPYNKCPNGMRTVGLRFLHMHLYLKR